MGHFAFCSFFCPEGPRVGWGMRGEDAEHCCSHRTRHTVTWATEWPREGQLEELESLGPPPPPAGSATDTQIGAVPFCLAGTQGLFRGKKTVL